MNVYIGKNTWRVLSKGLLAGMKETFSCANIDGDRSRNVRHGWQGLPDNAIDLKYLDRLIGDREWEKAKIVRIKTGLRDSAMSLQRDGRVDFG